MKSGERIATLLEHSRQRLTRLQTDFQGADGLVQVVGMNARGRRRTEARQNAMQRSGATAFPLEEPTPKRLIALGSGEQPSEQGADIDARAADHERRVPAGLN